MSASLHPTFHEFQDVGRHSCCTHILRVIHHHKHEEILSKASEVRKRKFQQPDLTKGRNEGEVGEALNYKSWQK